jgi:hypothetical protein
VTESKQQGEEQATTTTTTCTALFDYKAQRDVELSFKKGDVIALLSQRGKWWDGELNGKRGRLPSNYVKANQITPESAPPAPAVAQAPSAPV